MQTALLRHVLAVLSYRCTKAIRNAPAHYPEFEAGQGVRKPVELLWHMSNVLTFAHAALTGGDKAYPEPGNWEHEVRRFYEVLEKLDRALAERLPANEQIAEKLLQGPLADAMTHVGQLAMLRRLCGDPVPGENFFNARMDRINRFDEVFQNPESLGADGN